jgi:plasmid stabilization system protein ParE
MTRFTVVWQAQAHDDLAEIWVSGNRRAAVTAAAHQIDSDLRTDADIKGLPCDPGTRHFFVPPLLVVYDINLDDRIVRVLKVKLIP